MFGTLTHRGIRTESASATWLLGSSITSFDDIGKPVSQSATLDFTAEIDVDGAAVLGILESYEDRQVEGIKAGAVSWHGCHVFPYTGVAPTRGGQVVCDATGGVKAAGAGEGLNTVVTAVNTTDQTVEVLLK